MKKWLKEHGFYIWLTMALIGITVFVLSSPPIWASGLVMLALGFHGMNQAQYRLQREIDRSHHERDLIINVTSHLDPEGASQAIDRAMREAGQKRQARRI